MSNDNPDPILERASRETAADGPDRPTPASSPVILVLAGDDDLVCVDDTCLPPEAAR